MGLSYQISKEQNNRIDIIPCGYFDCQDTEFRDSLGQLFKYFVYFPKLIDVCPVIFVSSLCFSSNYRVFLKKQSSPHVTTTNIEKFMKWDSSDQV